jgi:hypothetical protein
MKVVGVVGLTLARGGLMMLVAPILSAKDGPDYEKGLLVSMDSTKCGMAENDGKTMTGEILGTDSIHRKTKEVLCQDYVLQGDHIIYHIRPEDEKHPLLLPVGDSVQFRIHKAKMYVLAAEVDHKEHTYQVISMDVRNDIKSARNTN